MEMNVGGAGKYRAPLVLNFKCLRCNINSNINSISIANPTLSCASFPSRPQYQYTVKTILTVKSIKAIKQLRKMNDDAQ